MNILWSQLLDAQTREPMSHINRFIESLSLDNASDKSASKGITDSQY